MFLQCANQKTLFFIYIYIFSFARAAYKINTCKLIVILNLKWLPYQVHFASKSQLFKTHFNLKCYKIVLILTLIDMLYRCWQYLTWKYSIKMLYIDLRNVKWLYDEVQFHWFDVWNTLVSLYSQSCFVENICIFGILLFLF